jgi:hypothetical protein
MAGLTPEEKAFYIADLAQVNASIASLQQNIAENQAAINEAQTQINVAQATIESDQLNLANPNLDPASVPVIEANIAEANASISENQAVIQTATNNIAVDQNQLEEQELYRERDQQALTGTAAPSPVTTTINGQPVVAAVGVPVSQINQSAGTVQNNVANPAAYNSNGQLNPGYVLDLNNNPVYVGLNNQAASPVSTSQAAAVQQNATLRLAQQQQTIAAQQRTVNYGDWRVKLSLAPNAKYLYNSSNPGILQPLSSNKGTGGVIFPYTPSIDTAYRANYSSYDLTHSNYRGYFYQNSYVDAVNMRAVFTAQNTNEANYLLAVIHFFRSVTKMFYGATDSLRGSPPPLVFLTGLGSYQFAQHPCVVSSFTYNLPSDVDYIRALSNSNLGTNQQNQQINQSTVPTNGSTSSDRLANNGLPAGATATPNPAPTTADLLNSPTYVPTKLEISITLLPIQSRQQVSQNFNMQDFASGTLLNGGYW